MLKYLIYRLALLVGVTSVFWFFDLFELVVQYEALGGHTLDDWLIIQAFAAIASQL